MKRFVLGCIAGGAITFSLSLSASAQPNANPLRAWFNGTKLMGASRPMRLGYAAGLADAVEIVNAINAGNLEEIFEKPCGCQEDRGVTWPRPLN